MKSKITLMSALLMISTGVFGYCASCNRRKKPARRAPIARRAPVVVQPFGKIGLTSEENQKKVLAALWSAEGMHTELYHRAREVGHKKGWSRSDLMNMFDEETLINTREALKSQYGSLEAAMSALENKIEK